MQFTAKQLGKLLKAEIDGDPQKVVQTVAKIEDADESSISFIANDKYKPFVNSTKAGILIVDSDLPRGKNKTSTFLRVKDPYTSFSIIIEQFNKWDFNKNGVDEYTVTGDNFKHGDGLYLGAFSYIGDGVVVGNNVKIFPNCYIGDHVRIGSDTIIYPGVSIYHHCEIGNNCIIHSGSVIGSDGFGFAPQEDGSYKKILQTGNVVVEDYVEIGSNTTIDRATMGSTFIRRGVKLDNLIQIAHNVEVGEFTVMAAQSGIAGSSKVGKNCMIGGQAGLVHHVSLADQIKVGAQSGITKSFKDPNMAISGTPANSISKTYRNEALIRKLPEMMKKIQELEEELKVLKGKV